MKKLVTNMNDASCVLPVTDEIANSWSNEPIRMLLQRIGQKSMGYQIMHERQAGRLTRHETWLNLWMNINTATLAILSTSSLLTVIAEIKDNSMHNNLMLVISVVDIVFVFSHAIAVGITQTTNFAKEIGSHRSMAYNWSCLFSEIQKQFSVQDRDAKELTNYSMEQYNNLLKNSVDTIPRKVLKEYENETKDMHIQRPLIVSVDNLDSELVYGMPIVMPIDDGQSQNPMRYKASPKKPILKSRNNEDAGTESEEQEQPLQILDLEMERWERHTKHIF
jgi:hypothetical protein